MSDNLMEKVSAFGERLKISGSEVGRKMTEGMTSMSFKMKEFFQVPNEADKIVEAATSETLDGPDWAANLEICDMINSERASSVELIRAMKKRMMMKSSGVQYLALVLLETCVKNCEKAFAEVAGERVLDEMVKLIDDPLTVVNNRNKALVLIEAWGESGNELRYLPVFEETYKSLKSRGIRFPGRDDESLAPIFTPPSSVTETESYANAGREVHSDVPVQSFTAEQTKEAFDVARNSIELLSTVLSSSPQQDVLQTDVHPGEFAYAHRPSQKHLTNDANFEMRLPSSILDGRMDNILDTPVVERIQIHVLGMPGSLMGDCGFCRAEIDPLGQDDLTTTLIQQCKQCQYTVQRIIETAGDNEASLFEALNVNDELLKVLSKYDELKRPPVTQSEAEPAMIPVAVEPVESPRVFSREDALVRKPAGSRSRLGEDDDMMDDLDEMIFGKKGGGSSVQKDDLISF